MKKWTNMEADIIVTQSMPMYIGVSLTIFMLAITAFIVVMIIDITKTW